LNGLVRVVFLILDGLPVRHVGNDWTPHLAALIAEGGAAPGGGLAEMTAATYPNHRTFATGMGTEEHGMRVNDDRHHPGPEPTIFDVCRAYGISVEAVLGDHHLVSVMGADRADRHWPLSGKLPEGAIADEYGYATDRVVLAELLPAIERGPQLLVAHLNDPDTAGHVLGSDTEAAHLRYRATDVVLGEVVDALRPSWDDLVLIVVSDHDHEMLTVPPTDVRLEAAAAGIEAQVHEEGSAALVLGDAPLGAWLAARAADPADDGVEGLLTVEGGWIVWPTAGGWYGPTELDGIVADVHGSPRTQAQVAVVAGGHPQAERLAAAISDGDRPNAKDWAPTIAALLGVPMPSASGRSLV
jgi:hypothetical protein